MSGRTFKAAFCEQSGCDSDKFPDAVFLKCLYPHAVPFAFLMGRLDAHLFAEDRKAIEQFGICTTFREVRAIVDDLRYVNGTNKHWLRTGLKIRVSGRRLYQLAERLAGEGSGPQSQGREGG